MPPAIRVLHAIHDYLPRHQAGSEIYVANLCAAQARAGAQPAVVAAEFDTARAHGQLVWREHAGVPVAEVVNTWQFRSFEHTYTSPELTAALDHVLDMIQPHVVHVHNLLNLTFDLPARARARGIVTVATLHDYTLVCPSGGQRVHRDEHHVCRTIDPARCARCFPASPFQAQLRYGQITRRGGAMALGRLSRAALRLAPRLTTAAAGAVGRTGPTLDAGAIERRLDAARRAFDALQHVVAPSRSLADEFVALGFPADRLEVSDYGFPPLVTRPRSDAGRLRVGFVGTLVWHKGADVLVEAAAALSPERIDVRIFGDPAVFPDYTRALEARATSLPVRFMGPFSHDRAAEVFAGLDVLVVPSRWLENSPLVIHEAFMAGVPVIGSAIGGIVDLIDDGRSGLLVPPDDAPALARAIQALVDSPSRLDAMRRARPLVKHIDDDAREWMERYQALAAGARAVLTAAR